MLCFTRYDTEHIFRLAMGVAGFKCKAQVIWDKVVHGMGDLKGDFASQHENIIFATKGRFKFHGKRGKSVIRVQRVDPDKLVHPNEKPVELIEQLVELICVKGGTVLDPFAGSGTTGVACKRTGRDCILIEQSPEYIKIIKARNE